MKNLFQKSKRKTCFGIIVSSVFAMVLAVVVNSKTTLFGNANAGNDYTVTFNRSNGGEGFPSSYGSGTNNSGRTNNGTASIGRRESFTTIATITL